MALGPQAALETAVRDAIRTQLGYAGAHCARMFDGRPPPACGQVFVSVWGDNRRPNESRTALDERLSVNVTVTARVSMPFDRAVRHRDDLESRMNAIRALVHKDSWTHDIKRAANDLAELTYDPMVTSRPVGLCEALAFARLDAVQMVGGEWFAAEAEKFAGLTQTAYFDRARWVQAILTAR